MRNLLGILFFTSFLASIILVFVSGCNYLIASQTTGVSIKEAYANNVYVSYWVNLLFFFIGVTILTLIPVLIMKPKEVVDEGMRIYDNQRVAGLGPVDEYVTVRVKRDDLSKLQ